MFKIYMTYRNSDMTEGRGIMLEDKAFSNYEDAAEYIDKQKGIMGRCAKWSKEKHGDWQMKEIHVLTEKFDETAYRIEKALAKLTKDEKILLGLERE